MTYQAPPLPTDPLERERVIHSHLRHRILYSRHRSDVESTLERLIGRVRKDKWGELDLSHNPFTKVWTEVSGLYRDVPKVVPPDGAELVAAAMMEQGYWSMMQRIQRDTLGMREMLVRVDYTEEHGLQFTPVPPHLAQVVVSPYRRMEPVEVRELVQHGDEWVTLVTIPAARKHFALDRDGNDVSAEVIGRPSSGADYPWQDSDGNALMPYVTYHASRTGHYWDPWTASEVVEGTLLLASYYTFFGHVMRTSSWSQRVVVGAVPAGAETEEGTRNIIPDPSMVLGLLKSVDYEGQPLVTQWSAPVDPDVFLRTIEAYESRLIEDALGSLAVTRKSADVRSGYSLAVSRETQRAAMRAYAPQFERSDIQMLELVSKLMRSPSDGWRISYRGLPADPAELRAQWERVTALLNAGMISRTDAYLELHPDVTRDEAIQAIADIDRGPLAQEETNGR